MLASCFSCGLRLVLFFSLFLLFSLLVEEGSATSCFDLLTLTSSASSTPLLLSWLLTLARSWPCLLLLRWLLAEGGVGVAAAPLSCCWLACGCSGGKSWRWLLAALADCPCCCDHRGSEEERSRQPVNHHCSCSPAWPLAASTEQEPQAAAAGANASKSSQLS